MPATSSRRRPTWKTPLVTSAPRPTGRVRVGLTPGAARLVTPGLVDLINRYPGLSVDFVVREQFGDLIEDRLDLAMRLGQPTDASLVARSVGEFGRALVASPPTWRNTARPPTQPA